MNRNSSGNDNSLSEMNKNESDDEYDDEYDLEKLFAFMELPDKENMTTKVKYLLK